MIYTFFIKEILNEHNNKMIANRKMNFNVYNKLEDNKHLLNFLFKPKK